MFTEGKIKFNGIECSYSIEHVIEPNVLGMGGGRITRLIIMNGGYVVCSYHEGWDVEPCSDTSLKLVEMLMEKFN